MQAIIDQIVAALEKIQTEGGKGNFVVFDVDVQKNYYVQASGQFNDSLLMIEAVSDEYLAQEHRLSAEQKDLLGQLGWNSPDGHQINYCLDANVETADQRLQLAEKIYATLSQVYDLQPDQEFGVNLVLE
jgi:phage terminase Nu1 subunit (DNA packaging protein)